LSFSRRKFLRSLSQTALVLPFSEVLSLGRSIWTGNFSAFQSEVPQKKAEAEIGVNFVNIALESGLNAKTIYGGEHKNKYLLETTGCGVAFYDYDKD
jgi:hypothetical protein